MVIARNVRIVTATLTYLTLVLFSIFCLFPFLWMLDTALKPTVEVMSAHPTFWIASPTLQNFRSVLFESDFLTYFRKDRKSTRLNSSHI